MLYENTKSYLTECSAIPLLKPLDESFIEQYHCLYSRSYQIRKYTIWL